MRLLLPLQFTFHLFTSIWLDHTLALTDGNTVLEKASSSSTASDIKLGAFLNWWHQTKTEIHHNNTLLSRRHIKQSRVNCDMETFSYRGPKNKYVCNSMTIGRTLNVHPADSIGSPRKIPSSRAFQRNKEQTRGHATVPRLNLFLVPFVALIDE